MIPPPIRTPLPPTPGQQHAKTYVKTGILNKHMRFCLTPACPYVQFGVTLARFEVKHMFLSEFADFLCAFACF